MKLYTRDWLDSKELRRCSVNARAVLIDLMCLASEGEPCGYLADKVGPLTEQYMASRCVLSPAKFRHAVTELIEHGRLKRSESGALWIERMVTEEAIRVKRAAGGGLGGNPNLVRSDGLQVDRKVNLPPNLSPNLASENEVTHHSRTRTRADSVSVFCFSDFCNAFPRKSNRARMQQAWSEVVHSEALDLVKTCLDRYLASDEVSRGVVMNGDRWLYEQAANQWSGDWPVAQISHAKRFTAANISALPAADPRDEIAAIRSLIDDENETESNKELLRKRLAELEREAS